MCKIKFVNNCIYMDINRKVGYIENISIYLEFV